jgi:hypothetical protein
MPWSAVTHCQWRSWWALVALRRSQWRASTGSEAQPVARWLPAGSEAPVRVDSIDRGLELLDVSYPACVENNDKDDGGDG